MAHKIYVGSEKVFDPADYEVAGAVASHAAAADPHPGYLTPAEGDAAYDPAGTAAGLVGTLGDLTTTEKGSAVGAINEVNSQLAAIAPVGDINITNLVSNGDFNTTTGWTPASGTGSVENNTYSLKGNGSSTVVYVRQTTAISAVPERKIRARANVRVITDGCTSISLLYRGSTSGTAVTVEQIDSPVINQWYELSGIITITNQTPYHRVQINHVYDTAGASLDKVLEIQYVSMFDLSADFGLGLEPDETEISQMIADEYPDTLWFDGEQAINYPGIYDGKVLASASGAVEWKNINSLPTVYRWYGSKVNFLGDSITYGVGASDDAHRFSDLLKSKMGFAVMRNYGISGTLITQQVGKDDAFVDRYSDMSGDADLVVVLGGINDYYVGTGVFGINTSTTVTEFYGALNTLIQGLITKYPTATIVFATPFSAYFGGTSTDTDNAASGENLKGYRDAIIERCQQYAIPVIDLYAIGGMDMAHNVAHRTAYSSDNLHPNDDGHALIANRLAGALAML